MISYWFYKFSEALALAIPLKLAYALAKVLSGIYYIFAFRDRKMVTDNLKVIFPLKGNKEIASIRFKVFRNFAKYLVDFLRFKKLDKKYIRDNVKVINIESVEEGLRRGKGVILLTAHLGNWELGGMVISQLGYSLLSVALAHKSPKVDRFFNDKRESKGMEVLPLGKAAKGCLRGLRKNRLLALVGDRDFTDKGRITNFFGKPAILPEGAAVLSLQTGAVIIPGFMLRNNDDSFNLIFEKPLEFNLTMNRGNDLDIIISKCKSVLEEYIRAYPDQWYMFRRFWKE
ncbi:MAG: lysophospholipid acyltransferase family protein [Candidatus Omnitrophica bacterium]|nr:lysophospholipid acyltransferase family protein [Candidatus Omnitrophota bacterium]